MNTSPEINEIAAALVSARKKFGPALKNAFNPSFKSTSKPEGSKYADLSSAIQATDDALIENNIIVLQTPSGDTERRTVAITTRLMHTSGQWIEGTLDMPAVGRNGYDAQSVGSAITYGRRYAYMAMLGIAPEDDDGNGASGQPQPPAAIQRKSEKVQIGITANDEPIFDDNGEQVIQRQPATPKDGSFFCPKCKHIGSIIKSKPEYGGGWVCFKGKGGCGAKFPERQFLPEGTFA